jgi:hypothetical protein
LGEKTINLIRKWKKANLKFSWISMLNLLHAFNEWESSIYVHGFWRQNWTRKIADYVCARIPSLIPTRYPNYKSKMYAAKSLSVKIADPEWEKWNFLMENKIDDCSKGLKGEWNARRSLEELFLWKRYLKNLKNDYSPMQMLYMFKGRLDFEEQIALTRVLKMPSMFNEFLGWIFDQIDHFKIKYTSSSDPLSIRKYLINIVENNKCLITKFYNHRVRRAFTDVLGFNYHEAASIDTILFAQNIRQEEVQTYKRIRGLYKVSKKTFLTGEGSIVPGSFWNKRAWKGAAKEVNLFFDRQRIESKQAFLWLLRINKLWKIAFSLLKRIES